MASGLELANRYGFNRVKEKTGSWNPVGICWCTLWLRDQDSNLGPRGYEPRELPLLHPAT
jgi:hypothetical protein